MTKVIYPFQKNSMKNLKGEHLPIEHMAFWQLIKEIVEQVVNESKLQ